MKTNNLVILFVLVGLMILGAWMIGFLSSDKKEVSKKETQVEVAPLKDSGPEPVLSPVKEPPSPPEPKKEEKATEPTSKKKL